MANNVLPKRPTLNFAGNDSNWKLLIRIVAPNDPSALQWVQENAEVLNCSASVLGGVKWEDAVLGNEPPSNNYQRHHQKYAIYKSHREIARLASSSDAQKLGHALLSKIVWFHWDPAPDKSLELIHLLEIRRALCRLVENAGNLPKLDELKNEIGWLHDFIQPNLKSDKLNELTRLGGFLTGAVHIGTRKRDASEKRTANDLCEKVWKTSTGSPRVDKTSFPEERASAKARELSPATRKILSVDDGNATDQLTIVESCRAGSDARAHVNYLEDVRLMASVKGYDRFETYTDQVAGMLLSKLEPDSQSGILAFLAIALGRNLKGLKSASASGNNGLVLVSTQEPARSVRVELPFRTDLLTADWKSAEKEFVKLTHSVSGVLGSRLSLGGMARFGVMRFHGAIGVVQSEQLQGRASLGSVTALYAQLSDADFQRALNRVLKESLMWIRHTAPYVEEKWKTWAGLVQNSLASIPEARRFYGSTRNQRLDQAAVRRAKGALRDAVKVYQEALDVATRKAA